MHGETVKFLTSMFCFKAQT